MTFSAKLSTMKNKDPMTQLLDDLKDEQDYLDAALADIDLVTWENKSPADGWLLRDCISHLADVDETAAYVATKKEMPVRVASGRTDTPKDTLQNDRQREARNLSIPELLAWWRRVREEQNNALRKLDAKERLPWAGPPMSVRSFATARLMECWSHGLDALDAAQITPVDSDRLLHVAHLGVITRGFAYQNRGLDVPNTEIRVELVSPSGDIWEWGPPDAQNRITGSAGEFCRVVTRRLHLNDTQVKSEGESASEYLKIAQAFAGPPGPDRQPKNH